MTVYILSGVALFAVVAAVAALCILGEQEREIARLQRELAARDAEIVRLKAGAARGAPVRLLTAAVPTIIVWN